MGGSGERHRRRPGAPSCSSCSSASQKKVYKSSALSPARRRPPSPSAAGFSPRPARIPIFKPAGASETGSRLL
ncbi:hypothetical protein BRADI_3g18335v3 [Brachypodium distachyon]|uniref:Uncharacterized protein n=1 Tax=Brachypodium distachyon TaxID=15368 RepID=A0A2K2CXZ4_BRADI|nr:hypothetical protein BRADI_3g18335v3 [Brachypodium distachyon]